MEWKAGMGIIGLAFASACGPVLAPKGTASRPDSVEIAQTPVRDQMKAGFCWAYAAVGLVESDYKMRTGKSLSLSEEALAFYRMAEGLHLLTQNLSGSELRDAIINGSLEGWLLKGDEGFPDAFVLLQKYGVVPEAIWSRKFSVEGESESLGIAVKRAMLRLIAEVPASQLTVDDIIENALLAPGAWDSAPPKQFSIGSKVYTPQSYLRATGFNPNGYAAVSVTEPSEVDKLIAATKRALVRGVSVPLGYPVAFARLKGDTFSGKNVTGDDPSNFFKEGGHAVLIKDFVNEGGKEGALPLAELTKEFLKPTRDLNYFVFKNSWGLSAKTNERGQTIRGSSTGYYKIDREYLVGAAGLTRDERFAGILTVVVPTDIAADPFGDETVNPHVALANE